MHGAEGTVKAGTIGERTISQITELSSRPMKVGAPIPGQNSAVCFLRNASNAREKIDQAMSADPIIPVCYRITCANGHLIATAKKNIGEFAGHRVGSYDFAIDPKVMPD